MCLPLTELRKGKPGNDCYPRHGVIESTMPTTINKQRVFQQLCGAVAKNGKSSEPQTRPVLEQFLYAICREGVTRELADRAFRGLRDNYFDWNEVRVSSPRELAETMDCLPDAEGRAQRLIDFLQEVFETTFSFDLESLQKKGVKQAAKQLSRYQAANDYVIGSVVQQSLGGHAIPLDNAALRVLRRLGIIETETDDLEAVQTSLEHQVPKAKAPIFCDTVSAIAYDHCHEDEPRCATCPMCSNCSTGQEMKHMPSAETSHRTKPR
jgi:endonuclease III